MVLLKMNSRLLFVMSETLATKYGEINKGVGETPMYNFSPTTKCRMREAPGLSLASCLLGAGFKEKDIKEATIMDVSLGKE